MQTVTNLYIVNLAIADECFLVGIPFLMVTTVLEFWPFGNIMCKIYFTTTGINQITSSIFLLVMSADRFVAVCHPISATKYRTPLIASIVALTAWSLSAILMTPIFLYASILSQMDRISCNIYWPSDWGNGTFMGYSFVLSFVIPLALISIFYISVIMRLQHVGPKRNPPIPSNKDGGGGSGLPPLTANQQSRARDRKKSHRKVTKLVLTVITVYFVCWLPYWISQLFLLTTEKESAHSEAAIILFLLANCLSYSNSAMNPILYAFLSDNFKKSFLKACSCANQKDVNAALHVENSVFPRNRKADGSASSEKRKGNKSGINTAQGGIEGKILMANTNHFSNPPKIITDPIDEDAFLDSDDEGVAILGRSTDYTETALTTRSDISKVTQETCIQDGVHITSL